jgi:surface antigen
MKRFQLLIKQFFPYVSIFLIALALMIFGSRSDDSLIKTPIAANFDDSSFTVTADQVSESYTVANIASSLALPSTSKISENFVTINYIYEATGTTSTATTPVVEKPTIIDTSGLSRGVISYVVKEGDTFDNIDRHGASKDQIRWSNGLKKETLTVGNTIYIPSVPGIVYKVKSGDTLDSIVKKTNSNKEEVIARNDLEGKDISVDQLLLLPNGSLPEKERPEYVPPRPRPTYNSYTYSYVSDVADRHNRTEVGSYAYWRNVYSQTSWQHNPGAFGNCTWFAWYWRRNYMGSEYWLPTGAIGNARSWISTLGGSYNTGRTPAYGAVMQSTSGRYGHVAVVVGVVQGQYITIQEMNYQGFNRVFQSQITWDDAVKYNYIYAHK